MNKTEEKRLRRLAEHLLRGRLGHKKFRFDIYHENDSTLDRKKFCGSLGCAIGELPVVWPKLFTFSDAPHLSSHYVLGKTLVDDCGHPFGDVYAAEEFFGVTKYEANYLFIPSEERAPWNRFLLGDSATKEKVAQGMLNFIEWKKSGGKLPEDME